MGRRLHTRVCRATMPGGTRSVSDTWTARSNSQPVRISPDELAAMSKRRARAAGRRCGRYGRPGPAAASRRRPQHPDRAIRAVGESSQSRSSHAAKTSRTTAATSPQTKAPAEPISRSRRPASALCEVSVDSCRSSESVAFVHGFYASTLTSVSGPRSCPRGRRPRPAATSDPRRPCG